MMITTPPTSLTTLGAGLLGLFSGESGAPAKLLDWGVELKEYGEKPWGVAGEKDVVDSLLSPGMEGYGKGLDTN